MTTENALVLDQNERPEDFAKLEAILNASNQIQTNYETAMEALKEEAAASRELAQEAMDEQHAEVKELLKSWGLDPECRVDSARMEQGYLFIDEPEQEEADLDDVLAEMMAAVHDQH